jgi:hypothetical protein
MTDSLLYEIHCSLLASLKTDVLGLSGKKVAIAERRICVPLNVIISLNPTPQILLRGEHSANIPGDKTAGASN